MAAKDQVKDAAPKAKFVVLHTQVGTCQRGQVVDVDAFPEPARLLTIGAVRSALPHECNLEKVNLDVATAPTGQPVAELQQKVLDLKAVVDEQAREIQKLKSIREQMASSTDAVRVNDLANKVATGEQLVKELQAQLAEKETIITSLKSGKSE